MFERSSGNYYFDTESDLLNSNRVTADPRIKKSGISTTFERELLQKESYRNRLEQCEQENKYLRKENSKLREKLQDSETKNTEISSKFVTLSSKYKLTKQQLKNISSKAPETKFVSQKIQETANKQSELVQELLNESQEKSKTIFALKNELNDSKLLINQLRNQISLEENKANHLTEDIERQKEKLKQALNKLAEEKKKRRDIAKTATGALTDSAQSSLNYEQMIDNLQNENNVLSQTHEKSLEQVNKLKEKSKKQNEIIAAMKEENEELVKEVENMKRQNEIESNKVIELTHKADELNQTLLHNRQLLESRVTMIESENAEKAAQYEETAKNLSQQNLQLQKKVTFAEGKIKEYQDQIQSMSVIEEQQETKFASFKKSLQEFREQKEAFSAMLNETQTELETEKITKNSLTTKIEVLTNELNKSREQFKEVTKMLSQVNARCGEQTNQINSLVKQNVEYRSVIHATPERARTFINNMQKQFNVIASKLNVLDDRIKRTRIENEELANNNETLMNQVRETTKSILKHTEDKTKIAEDVDNAVQTICYLTGTDAPQGNVHVKLRCAVAATEKMADEITQSRASIAQYETLNECRDNFQEERTKLYDGINELRSALKITKKSLLKSEAENAQLRKEIASNN